MKRCTWLNQIRALGLAGIALLAPALAGCVTYVGPKRSNFIVRKEALYVGLPDAEHRVVVGGSIGFRNYTPRTVGYEIVHKESGATVTGSLQPDGSFRDTIPACAGDKIRVMFRDERGESKSRILKVPGR